MIDRRALLLGVAALPASGATRAQVQPARPRILGLISLVTLPAWLIESFRAGMRDLGWQEGSGYILEQRVTGPDAGLAFDMPRELLKHQAELLITASTLVALKARKAAPSLPIVMMLSGYPVEAELAESLARPGGMVTGLSNYAGGEVFARHVRLLKEARPGLRHLVALWDYMSPDGEVAIREMQVAAKALDIKLEIIRLRRVADQHAALDALDARPVDALFVTVGPVNLQPASRARLRQFIQRHHVLVAIDAGTVGPHSNAILAYSANQLQQARRTAWYVDRILKGARPGDLPIEVPATVQLQVNLRLARELGIEIPASILSRAVRVIE